MTASNTKSREKFRVMLEQIKHIPIWEKHLVSGFIFDIIEQRPILVLCNLVAVYYHETEEFGAAGNAIEISSDKKALKFVKDDFDSAYGTILIDENTNYVATWHIRVFLARWRGYSHVWVGISSKQVFNEMYVLPAMYNWQHNIFYAIDQCGNKEQKEFDGARQRFKADDIVKVIFDARKKELKIIWGDECTCFNAIKMQYSPFRLAICGGLEGDSLQIIKFEKHY